MLCVMLSLLASTAAAGGGRVHWWLGSYNANYTQQNADFLAAHGDVDGVLHCCTGLQVLSDGSVAPPDSSLLSSLTRAAHQGAGAAMLRRRPPSSVALRRPRCQSW